LVITTPVFAKKTSSSSKIAVIDLKTRIETNFQNGNNKVFKKVHKYRASKLYKRS
jgi:hypothetical protein